MTLHPHELSEERKIYVQCYNFCLWIKYIYILQYTEPSIWIRFYFIFPVLHFSLISFVFVSVFNLKRHNNMKWNEQWIFGKTCIFYSVFLVWELLSELIVYWVPTQSTRIEWGSTERYNLSNSVRSALQLGICFFLYINHNDKCLHTIERASWSHDRHIFEKYFLKDNKKKWTKKNL